MKENLKTALDLPRFIVPLYEPEHVLTGAMLHPRGSRIGYSIFLSIQAETIN